MFTYSSSLVLWGNSSQHSTLLFLLTQKIMKCSTIWKPCRLSCPGHSFYKNRLNLREIQLIQFQVICLIGDESEIRVQLYVIPSDFGDYRWIDTWPSIWKQETHFWNYSTNFLREKLHLALKSEDFPIRYGYKCLSEPPSLLPRWLRDIKGI